MVQFVECDQESQGDSDRQTMQVTRDFHSTVNLTAGSGWVNQSRFLYGSIGETNEATVEATRRAKIEIGLASRERHRAKTAIASQNVSTIGANSSVKIVQKVLASSTWATAEERACQTEEAAD